MRCACVDIGTNTTRLLVADAADGALEAVVQEKAFTRIGTRGAIAEPKIVEVGAVVAEQVALARRAGAGHVKVVATAAIRCAANRDAFVTAVGAAARQEVCVLDGEEEARLAFLGATRTLGRPLPGRVGVVDVGGGSTEVAVGTLAGGVTWARSVDVGSGTLGGGADDAPPDSAALARMAAAAAAALAPLVPPRVDDAVAVGGSAASLRRVVGDVLDRAALDAAVARLTCAPAREVAAALGLERERVRLLPAGLLILHAAAARLGRPLLIGYGGLREGVLLDLVRTL